MSSREVFYSSLNVEDITDVDYRHVKRVYWEFNNKNVDDYHDLYVQNDTFLLADLLENLEICMIYINQTPVIFFNLQLDWYGVYFNCISCVLMQTICMGGQCHKNCL